MLQIKFWLLLALSFNLISCKTTNKLNFLNYSIQSNGGVLNQDPFTPPRVSDGLALNYANCIELIMRSNSTKSRITREVSATVQIALAAFAGAGAALDYSKTTLVILGLGSAGIPELQSIFNSKGRAEVYNQAADMIQGGVLEYYSHNPSPSSSNLTANGLTLVKRVSAAISLVDTAINNQIPSRKQMLEAVEPMTAKGAATQVAGQRPLNSLDSTVILERQAPESITQDEFKSAMVEAIAQADLDKLQKPAITAFNKWKIGKSDSDTISIMAVHDSENTHQRTINGLLILIRSLTDEDKLNAIKAELGG